MAELNPLTGLPYTKEQIDITTPDINPLTGKNYTSQEMSRTSRVGAPAQGLTTPQLRDNLASYKKYGVSLSRFADHEEDRARYQSRAEKWGRGLMKGGVTAIGAVADGTLGLLSGIGEAAYHQDFSYFYNNSVGKQVDKINNWMGENYANYYTRAEEEAEGLASLGYANFWADKAMNGIGYAVGAIGTVYLTGGAGLLTRGLNVAAKGSRYYRAAKLVSTGAAAADRLKGAARAGRALKGVQMAEIGMMMSAGESNVEAREALHRTTDALKQQRADELGIKVSQLSDADIADIHDQASSAANMVWGLNMSVLSATNMIGFGRHLMPKFTNMRTGMKGLTKDAKTGKWKDFWKESPTWGGVVDRYLKGPIRDGLSEAVQESSQFLFQEGADKVINRPGGGNMIEDWTESMMESYGDIYGTKEGKESAMLGFIVGALMGGFASVKQYANATEIDANRKKIVDSLNDPAIDKALGMAARFKKTQESAQKAQDALEKGDHKAYRDAQFEMLRDEIAMHYENGTLDLYLERLDDAALMEDEEFKEAFNIPKDVKFDKNKAIQSVRSKIKEYEELREQVESAFTTRAKTGIDRAFMSKEEKEAEKEMLTDEAMLRNKIIEHGMGLKDKDGRIDHLIEELNELRNKATFKEKGTELSREDFAEVGPVAEIVEIDEQGKVTKTGGGNITAEAAVKLQELEDAIRKNNPIEAEEAKKKIADLKRLLRDRNVTVGAIAELSGRPEEMSTAIAREKAKQSIEHMRTREKSVRERMQETNTAAELTKLMADVLSEKDKIDLSPEFKKELLEELARRTAAETDMMDEMVYEDLSRLRAELAKEEDPVRKAVLQTHIAEREAQGREEGIPRPEKSKAKASEEREAAREAINKKHEEAKAAAKAEHAANQTEEKDPPKGSTQTEGTGITRFASQGRFEQDKDNKYVLRDGQLQPGNLEKDVLNGVTLNGSPAKIDYEAQRETMQGDTVDLVHLGTNKNGFQVVGIVKDGKLVGVLKDQAGSVGLLVEGESKPARVSQRFDGNPINTPEMRSVEFLLDVPSFIGFAVRRNERFDAGEGASKELQEAVAILNDNLEKNKAAIGGVVAVVRAPNGDIKPLVVSTKAIGEKGAQDLLGAIFEGKDLTLIRQEFGITNQVTTEAPKFIIEQIGDKLIVSWEIDGNIVSFNAEQLQTLYETDGKNGEFTVGSFQPVEVDGEKTDEMGFVKSKNDPTTDLNRDEFRAQALARLKEILPGIRYQVDRTLVGDMGYVKGQMLNRVEVDFMALPNGELFVDPRIVVEETTQAPAEEVVEKVGQQVEQNKPESTVVRESEEVSTNTDEEFDEMFGSPEGKVVSEEPFEFAPEQTEEGAPSVQEVEYKNNTYVVDINTGTITNKKTGKTINATSSTGAAVLKLVDFDGKAFRLGKRSGRKLNRTRARKFLQERFGKDAVVIFDQLIQIGDDVAHGFVQNGAVYLWNNAEIGTEYHEAFHLMFRTLMSEEQREALYQSAVETYGEPTAEEIEAARRGQPNMSKEEARKLALEERMAEEFREYMLNEETASRNLPQRIAKFFRDLYAYIKAVVTGRATVDQAFSLLEKNRIPKSFTRNASKFAPGPAFMLKQYAANPQMHKELVDISIYKVLNAMEESKESAEDLMGNAALGESVLRDWFLKSAFNRYGQPLSRAQFLELKEAIDNGNPKPVIAKYGISPGAPIEDEFGNPYPQKVIKNAAAAKKFYNVYKNWFDNVGEQGETLSVGFRSEIAERLKNYGLKLQDNSLQDAEADFERIFALARLQEDPAKKLSEKAKRTLSRIPVSTVEESMFGFQTYVPIDEVFTKIGIAVAGTSSLTEMLSQLEVASQGNPELGAVYNFVNNLGAQEKALFYSSLAQSVSEFRMVLIDSDENGNKVVKILDPGVGSIGTDMYKKWYQKATSSSGIYTTDVNEDGQLTFTINDNKKKKAIAKLSMAVSERLNPSEATLNALANGLWELGIELGPTREIALERVMQTFSNKAGKYDEFLNAADIPYLIDSLKRNQNIYLDADSKIKEIGNIISRNFETATSASFVDAMGRDIFALNLKTDLDITAEMIRSGEYGRLIEDKVGHHAGDVKTLATLLLTEPRGKYAKDFVPITFSAFKQEIEAGGGQVSTYEDMSYQDALAVSLSMFRNRSNPKMMYIAMDTPGDRNRLVYIPIPNWLDGRNDVDYPYGLAEVFGGNASKEDRTRELVKRQLLVDLHRIHLGHTPSIPIKGYHDGGYRALQTGGELASSQDEIALLAHNFVIGADPVMPAKVQEFINQETEKFMAFLEAEKQAMIKQFGGEQKLKEFVVANVNVKEDAAMGVIEDFLKADILGRMMTRQIFRSGVNYVKDGATYHKRATLTTTPGTQVMMEGEVATDPEYGMPETFTEITVQDIEVAVENVEGFREELTKQVGEEAAQSIIDSLSNVNTTDAQAFITPAHYRNLRQGLGLWTKEDEAQYQKDGTIKTYPMKPSYEGRVEHEGHLVPVSHKNSYIVLTRELAEGNPQLMQLLDRMEAKGAFEGMERIDVVNTESAKKLGSFVPVDGTSASALAEAPVMTVPSRGLKFPQMLPESFKDKITFGRQPRKNSIANIDDNTTYIFNGQPVKGKALKEMYQRALVAKLELNKQRVFQELGFDKVLEARESGSRQAELKAMEDMLPKLRDKMKALGVEKDYPQNFLDALEIVKDEDGNLTTRIPLSFPHMHAKLDQLLLGLFRTEVYKQKLPGQELVQFSEYSSDQEGSLKFYTLEGQRIVEAEADVPADMLESMGVDTSRPIEEINEQVQRLIGYRIPQQGKASMLVMKIRKVLPKGSSKAIRVPNGTTAMMGSDFDVDKMFVVFPEIVKGERVQFDMNADPATMTEKQLNNLILETFAAVGTNSAHLGEILGGVEIVDIKKAIEDLGLGTTEIDINSAVQRIQTGLDNMLSGVLRGIYANAIAGRNVAEASGIEFRAEAGIQIEGIEEALALMTIVGRSPFSGKFTDQYMSQYLSAAVDSVKDPLQASINDNAVTAPLTIYMLSLGMTPQQAIRFLTTPEIKAITEQARLQGESILSIIGPKIDPVTPSLSETGKPMASGNQLLGMLKAMAMDASALSSLYSMITPDAIDKAGTTPQHLAMMDKLRQSNVFGGPEALGEITQGEAYPIAKAYIEAIEQSLEVARSVGLIGTQPGVTVFKANLKLALGRVKGPVISPLDKLTDIQHRDINRAILHHIVTQEGSPLFESGLLDVQYVEELYFGGGFQRALEAAREENGDNMNRVLESLELTDPEAAPNGLAMVRMQIDPTKVKTKLDKDMWTATFLGMMNNPQYQPIIDAIMTMSIVGTGFAPGPNSAFDLIPVEKFEQLGVTTHMAREMRKLNDAENSHKLTEFVDEFISSYGTHRTGRIPLIKQISGIHTPVMYMPKSSERYVVVNDNGNKVVYMRGENGQFFPTQTKGMQYKFYEANLRDRRTGEKFQGSVLRDSAHRKIDASRPSESRLDMGGEETLLGAEQKIERLKAAFAEAGVDVVVQLGELAPGVKGQVEGKIVTLDPNQMTDDTVYHEFGHILVDMLPQNEVKKYVQQIVKANPALARAVKAKYPNLEGLELGKEILVTAIGLEGAKLERKNPSKVQRIVNKILRAIGKLFGIQPNAAAMLAEQMFGAEIRAEQLVNQVSAKVQRSVTLEQNIEDVTKDVLKSLTRQKIGLQNLPQTERTEDRLLEIKALENRISEMRERQQELADFLHFQQYVVARVERLETLMDEIYAKKDQPLTKEERLKLMQQISEVKETLDSLYNSNSKQSTVNKVLKLLNRMNFGEAKASAVTDVYLDLQNSLARLELLEEEYGDVVIPTLADTLLTYADTGLADQIDAEIARIRETKDIAGFRKRAFMTRDPEFLALRRKRKNDEISEEDYIDALVELKVDRLKKKRPGRDQMIQELRDAHRSKNAFSFMLDPLVYSREGNMQLFALAIKDALNNATENTRGFLFELEEKYEAFKSFKGGDFNEAQFNEDLLTTVTIGDVEVLALVQQYDTDKFYKAREAEYERLAVIHGRPKDVDSEEYKAWRESQASKDYNKDLTAWYKQNTERAPGAEVTWAAMEERAGRLQVQISQETSLDRKGLLEAELKDLQLKMNRSYDRITDTWKGDLAVPNESYVSEKYKKIQSTPELKAYYDFVLESYQKAQDQIGKSQLFVDSWNKHSYVMPSVRKDKLAKLQEEGWKEAGREVLVDFQKQDTDVEFGMMTTADGEGISSIPRFYTNRVPAKDVSRDIAASLAQFTHMSNMFQEKGKVVGLVEAMMHAHENRATLEIDENTGNRILDEVSRRALGITEYATGDPKSSYTYRHLKEFVDSVFYGQFDLDQGAVLGMNISKLAGKAAGFTAVANLAFNTLQVGNQFVLDNLMGLEEAVAGQFFSTSDMAWATKTYLGAKAALSDLGAFVPKSKLGQAMQMFDAMNETTDNMGKGITGSKLKKAMQSDAAFALQHAVEHESVGVRMLAVLRSYKGKLKDANGKVLLNEKGEEADLWDMLVKDEKGKFSIDPRVANVTRSQVIAKIHGVNKRTNQIKGSFDRAMGNRRAIGKLLLLFRNYFIPGLRKRFGHGDPYHVDYELGEMTRGMYLSFGSFLASVYEKGSIRDAYDMMSDVDKQNVTRTAFEAGLTMATMVIFSALNGMLDDDEEDNYLVAFGAYQARRLQTELMQFYNPGEAINIARSPMATVNWLGRYATIMNQMFIQLPGHAVGLVDEDKIRYQRRTGTAEKGDLKLINHIKKVTPVLNGWQTSFLKEGSTAAVEEKLRWFD